MRARRRIYQQDRQPQLASRLAQAAFQHIASAEFFADGTDIARLARIFRG
jgi:hypothetical protein